MGKNNRVTDLLAGFSLENLEVSGDEVQEQLDQTSEQVEEVEDRVEDVEEQVEEVEEVVDEHLTDPDAHSEVETVPAEPDPVEDAEGTDPIGGEVGEAELDLAVVDDEEQASEEVASVQDEIEDEITALDEASEIVSNTAEVVEGVDVETDDDVNPVEEIDTIIAVSNERLRLKLGALGKDLVFNTTSLEGRSFKSVQGRLMAKELALENLDQQQKGIFAKAIEAIKKAWEWIVTRVKELWVKLTGAKRRRDKIRVFLKDNAVSQKVLVENTRLGGMLGLSRNTSAASGTKSAIQNIKVTILDHCKVLSTISQTVKQKSADADLVRTLHSVLQAKETDLGGFGTYKIELSGAQDLKTFLGQSKVVIEPVKQKDVTYFNTLTSSEVIEVFDLLDSALAELDKNPIIKEATKGQVPKTIELIARVGDKIESTPDSDRARNISARYSLFSNYGRLFTTPFNRLMSIMGQLDLAVTMLGELTVKVAKGKDAEVKGGATPATEGISSTEGGPEVLTDDKDYEAGNDYDLNEGKDPGEFKNVKLDEGEIEQTEIGTVSAAIEQFEEMAEVLEEAGEAAELHDQGEEVIEAALSRNGLDESAATFMDIAAEAIHGRMLRLERASTPTLDRRSVSLENFRKSAYRLEATSTSLEDWKETGQNIMKAIREAIAKIVKMIRYVYSQAKTFFKGAKGRVERIQRAVQATPDTKMVPREIDGDKAVQRFRIGDKALDARGVEKGLGVLSHTMDAVIEDSSTLITAGWGIIKGRAEASAKILTDFNTDNELRKITSPNEKDGAYEYVVSEIPGGSEIVITRPKLEGELSSGFKASVTKKTEGTASVKPKTLSKSDAKKVLVSVSTALAQADSTSKRLDDLVKMVDDLLKDIKETDFDDKKERSSIKKAISGLSRVSSSEVFAVIKAQGLAIDTSLALVSRSTGSSAEEKKEEEK